MYKYLNIGGYISSEDIIGIFDLDRCTVSKSGKHYLNIAQKEGRIIYDSTELPKSFIVKKNNDIILSHYNTATIIQKGN